MKEEEEISCFDLPETTRREIIVKISAMASSIRNDWSDPRNECRHILRLCTMLIEMEDGKL
jgi:hypothetical protein